MSPKRRTPAEILNTELSKIIFPSCNALSLGGMIDRNSYLPSLKSQGLHLLQYKHIPLIAPADA